MLRHQLHEFLEGDLSAVVGVEDRHRDVDEGTAWFVVAVFSDGLTEVHGGQHAIIVIIKIVEDLLEDFDIPEGAFSHHELFGVEVDVLLGAETGLLPALLGGACLVLALAVAAAATAVLGEEALRTHEIKLYSAGTGYTIWVVMRIGEGRRGKGRGMNGGWLFVIIMKILKILIVVVYIAFGYWLFTSPYFNLDPMQQMSAQTGPLLEQLVQTKYFRIIRLNINQECPLGLLNKICKSNSCSVCRCSDEDIPQLWGKTDRVHSHSQGRDLWSNERQEQKGWVWHVQDESNDQGEYFDIHTNIESFTNYNGNSIWQLIYGENCFRNSYEDMCGEEMILYNLISGLHSSISTHLSRFYRHTNEHKLWADLREGAHSQFHFNHSEYQRRVLDHPQRIKNLFFIYRILAKAVKEASPYLLNQLNLQSENITEDLRAKNLLTTLLTRMKDYDLTPQEKESLKFFTKENPKVREYLKYIHNISNILNCVECEKCRLFGKMQTYGVGTAMKILLGYPTPYKRNEIVALLNVFNKISMSVDTYYKHRQEVIPLGSEQQNHLYLQIYAYVGSFLGLALLLISARKGKGQQSGEPKGKAE